MPIEEIADLVQIGELLGSISIWGRLRLSQKRPLGDTSDDIWSFQQVKIISDLFRTSYSYLPRPTRVKPKQKEVSHFAGERDRQNG